MKWTGRLGQMFGPCAVALWLLLLSIAVPAARSEPDASKVPPPACEQPCTHVGDCARFSCECEHATATGVAVCDTEKTHCCWSVSAACERFCEVNHQTWTGRFTPESPHPVPSAAADDAAAETSTAPCSEPCQEPKDCHTMSCQCAHSTVLNVGACDVKTHCCGSARVVCEHYCRTKKDTWTGKVVEDAPHHDGGALEMPYEDGGEDEPDDRD